MSEYTKGPWAARQGRLEGEPSPWWLITSESGQEIAAAWNEPNTQGKVVEANARLISASPDLLKACQAALVNIARLYAADISNQEYRHTYECLKAAIAKATATEGEVGR